MDVFAAIAQPTRRSILEMLAGSGQLSVADIAGRFRVSPPAISQHLKVLREARLVRMQKRKQQRIYEINPQAVQDTVAKVHAAGLRAKGLFIFGLPGETPETFRRTSDFILSLDLDDMNLTKFSPLHGAPLWAECVAGTEGDFIEDWRLLNCLNPVYRPSGFASREQMDALYNGHIQRFYGSRAYRRRFGRRLWEHRWSLWHLLRHLPQALAARRYFTSEGDAGARAYQRHPRQPVGLKPMPLGR